MDTFIVIIFIIILYSSGSEGGERAEVVGLFKALRQRKSNVNFYTFPIPHPYFHLASATDK